MLQLRVSCLLPRLARAANVLLPHPQLSSHNLLKCMVSGHRNVHVPTIQGVPSKESDAGLSTKMEMQELRDFDKTFDVVKKSVTAEFDPRLRPVFDWFEKMMSYNVPHGKRNRGLAMVTTYRQLTPEEEQTASNLFLARIVGWCVELLQAHLLVLDDIMDQSTTRRGQLCWYRQDGVQLTAVNDGLFLEAALYHLLHIYLSEKPYYMDLVNLFLETMRKTVYGQALDMLTTPAGKKPHFNLYNMERYFTIITYKTAYYSFSLPVRLAMYMSGINAKECHQEAENILLKMGQFFQIQDDYLDCFADPKISGKIGTDIEEGKCTWLLVTALEMANQEQVTVLMENYGVRKAEAVKRVKDLYKLLRVDSLYFKYEENAYNEICDLIRLEGHKTGVCATVFSTFLSKIHRRQK